MGKYATLGDFLSSCFRQKVPKQVNVSTLDRTMRTPIPMVMILFITSACSTSDGLIKVPETFIAGEISMGIAGAYCAAFRRCFNDVRPEHVLHESVCIDQLGRSIGQRLTRLETSVDEGRVSYDPEGLRRCIKAIGDASCREVDLEAFEAACAGVIFGHVTVGDPCAHDGECTNGFCPGEDGCESRCQGVATVGGSCAIDGDIQCQAGLDCSRDDVCERKEELQFLAGVGQLCHVHRCRAGLRCLRVPEPTCLPFALIHEGRNGDSCRAATDEAPEVGCARALVCSFPLAAMVTGEGVCRPLPQEGDACHLTIGGSSAWCAPGHFCRGLDPIGGVLKGVCAAFPETGQVCGDFYGDPRVCSPAERCTDGVCTARALVGSACEMNRDCVRGRCVDGVCAISCYTPEDPP